MKKQVVIRLSVLCICFLITAHFVVPAIKTFASEKQKSMDLSGLSKEMQCAVVLNGVEEKGCVYFVYDTYLYKYKVKTSGKDSKLQRYFKNVRRFFISDGYIYFDKCFSYSLYRVPIEGGEKKLVSRGVHSILYRNEEKIYYWGKKYLYEMNYDGSGKKKIFSNKGNRNNTAQMNETAVIYDAKLFYCRGVDGEGDNYWEYDHKLCVNDLKTGKKKTLVSPKGKNSEFHFVEIENELYAESGQSVYKYDKQSGTFKKLDVESQNWKVKIGYDGKYAYYIDDWYIFFDDGTYGDDPENDKLINEKVKKKPLVVYRLCKDWIYEPLFSIENFTYDEDDMKIFSCNDDYYCFGYWYAGEDLRGLCTDAEGNILYECYPWNDDISDFYVDSDSLSLDMAVIGDKLYILSHVVGRIGGARIVDLKG